MNISKLFSLIMLLVNITVLFILIFSMPYSLHFIFCVCVTLIWILFFSYCIKIYED